MSVSRRLLVCAATWAIASATNAHPAAGLAGQQAWPAWLNWALYGVGWLLYLRGALRDRPADHRRAIFHSSMLLAGLALFGPIDAAAAGSTAAHMLQHMLLIVFVAPMMVLARPLVQWQAALGSRPARFLRPVLASLRHPLGWATLHGVTLWIWHLPAAYTAALQHEALHALEHASFLFTAWGFWWSVSRAPPPVRGKALLALWLTLMHTGFLGALLVFAPRPLYFPESRTLADQQLAGLLMWAPGGVAYVLAAAWLGTQWLGISANTARPRAGQHMPSIRGNVMARPHGTQAPCVVEGGVQPAKLPDR